MLARSSVISCNFSSLQLKKLNRRTSSPTPNNNNLKPSYFVISTSIPPLSNLNQSSSSLRGKLIPFPQKGRLHIRRNSLDTQNSQDPVLKNELDSCNESGKSGGGGGRDGGEGRRDWTPSFLLFFLWGGILYYVFNIAPNNTPSSDIYFLKKLLFLTGDDGFQLNEVFYSLWYIMGLWPLLYSMLLLPTGRSSKGSIPVWPFLILSCFLGAYALLPYFVIWKPPPPTIEETELKRWPLNFLESKLTAGITLAAGLGIFVYAGIANEAVWKEFFQYFRGSKFIHVTSIDFSLLSAFAPFWVYNDMTARKWYDKGFWLLPFSLIPFLGPALYVLLRPSVSDITAASVNIPAALSSETSEKK